MKNAKKFRFFFTILMSLLCCAISCLSLIEGNIKAFAATESDVLYCDSMYGENEYFGQSQEVVTSYDVYFDRMEETSVCHSSVPSFTNGNPSYTNACAPLAGLNIVGFYDRWCINLLAGYEAGLVFANGKFQYYPYTGSSIVENSFVSLFNLMKTGELGGTTSSNFKSGLNTYVKNAGYNISYSSFYKSNNAVDLNKLTTAVNDNKVGLIMCSEYNYVYDIVYNSSQAHITKRNHAIGHMMMVYGYKTFTFYKDNAVIRTDTFLCVCSSYPTGEKGYMQLYDYANIEEALIISIA